MLYEMNDYDKLRLKKQRFFDLYDGFVKNRNLDLEEFLSNLSTSIGVKNLTVSRLNIYLCKNKKNFCVSKAELMIDILNYVSSKNKDKELKNKIENIVNRNSNLKKQELDFRSTKLHNEKIDNVLSNVNTLINENKSYNELLKSGEIDDQYLITNVNRFISNIDNETYINFMIAYKRVQKLSMTELNQLKETIEYFISNISKKLDLLNSCNPYEDEIKIRNIIISNEDELSTYYSDNIIRLYKWKVKKLTSKLDFYLNFSDLIDKLINKNDINNIKKISFDRKIMDLDEKFVEEYYKNIQTIYNTLAQIKKSNVNSDRNKVLCKIYNDNVIIENN